MFLCVCVRLCVCVCVGMGVGVGVLFTFCEQKFVTYLLQLTVCITYTSTFASIFKKKFSPVDWVSSYHCIHEIAEVNLICLENSPSPFQKQWNDKTCSNSTFGCSWSKKYKGGDSQLHYTVNSLAVCEDVWLVKWARFKSALAHLSLQKLQHGHSVTTLPAVIYETALCLALLLPLQQTQFACRWQCFVW